MADLDKSLQLEAVYYSAPAPRGLASLVILGLVFDRVHFPGVYVPHGDYDRDGWKAEIDRIAAIPPSQFHDSRELVALMKFVELSEQMPGFFAFDRKRDDPLDKDNDDRAMVERMYSELWGPPSDKFIPTFTPWHHKGVSGGSEHLTYPGDYYYQAAALRKAGELAFRSLATRLASLCPTWQAKSLMMQRLYQGFLRSLLKPGRPHSAELQPV